MKTGIDYYTLPHNFWTSPTHKVIDEEFPSVARTIVQLLSEKMCTTRNGVISLSKRDISSLALSTGARVHVVKSCLTALIRADVLKIVMTDNNLHLISTLSEFCTNSVLTLFSSLQKSYENLHTLIIQSIDFKLDTFNHFSSIDITTQYIQEDFYNYLKRREKWRNDWYLKSSDSRGASVEYSARSYCPDNINLPVDNSENLTKTPRGVWPDSAPSSILLENFKRGEGREDPPYPPIIETSFQEMGEGEPSESIMSQSPKEPLPPKPDDLDKPTLEARGEVLLNTLGVTIPEGSNASPSPESSQRFGPSERRFIEQALATCEPKAHETEVDYWYNKVLDMLKNHPEREKIYIGENLSKKVLEMRYVDIFLDGKTYIPELKKFIKTQKKLPNSVINPQYFSNRSIPNYVSTDKNFNLEHKTKLEMNKPKPFIFEDEEAKFQQYEELKRSCQKLKIRPENLMLAFNPIINARIVSTKVSGGFEVRERVAL